MKAIEQRKKFNKAFNLPIAKEPEIRPFGRRFLQYELMKEELEEYKKASTLPDVIDAMADMQEILFGMFAEHGCLDLWQEIYTEVHESNMSKLDKNGKPIINGIDKMDQFKPIGKVLKSNRFKKPNFRKFINYENS